MDPLIDCPYGLHGSPSRFALKYMDPHIDYIDPLLDYMDPIIDFMDPLIDFIEPLVGPLYRFHGYLDSSA